MTLPEVNIKLNPPQLILTMAQYKEQLHEWGRGTGKSTGLAWKIKDMVENMPRAKIGIVGSTYQQLLTRTLPSTIEGLTLLGFVKGLHYFVGKHPPKEWKWLEAHQPPLSYDNYITFYNGTGFQLISLDNPDSGRGLNLDAVIGDEASLMEYEKLMYNVLLSNRGNIHRFSHTWLHHSVTFFTTTPVTVKGRWVLKMAENAQTDPNVFHLRASSRYNLDNLGKDFFRQNKRALTDLIYNAEIECIRPGRVQTGFYPAFDEQHHTYEASNDNYVMSLNYDFKRLKGPIPDADLNRSAPLDIALDYGAKINSLVVEQDCANEARFLNAFFVKSPKTVMDVTQDFCDYYRDHITKEVNYWYDHTAIYKDAARATSFADEVTKVLEKNGWTVNRIYVGQAPRHENKYLFIDKALKGHENIPHIKLNQEKCKYLILSIEMAGVKEGRNGIEKDKSTERKQNAVDEETTHLSDAFDTIVFFKFKDRISSDGYFV